MSQPQQAFVVKTMDSSGYIIPGILEELQAGRARIGWSSHDDQDLRCIQERKSQGLPAE